MKRPAQLCNRELLVPQFTVFEKEHKVAKSARKSVSFYEREDIPVLNNPRIRIYLTARVK